MSGEESQSGREILKVMGCGGSKEKEIKNDKQKMWESDSDFSKELKNKGAVESPVKIVPKSAKELPKGLQVMADNTVDKVSTKKQHHDIDHLDLEALKASLKACGRNPELAEKILNIYDRDSSGGISTEEFQQWIHDNKLHPYDDDSSGDELSVHLARKRSPSDDDSSDDELAVHLARKRSGVLNGQKKVTVLSDKMKKKRDAARFKLSKAHTIQNIDGFSLLYPEQIEKILTELDFEIHTKGTIIMKQGAGKSDIMYFIANGQCDVLINKKIIKTLKELSFFGESMIYQGMDDRVRVADVVVSSSEVQVLTLHRSTYRSLCRKGIITKECQNKLKSFGEKRKNDAIIQQEYSS
jgi:hypothetical protein